MSGVGTNTARAARPFMTAASGVRSFDYGKQFAFYGRRTTRLFEAILSQSGKKTIVDSSKLPGRAMALALVPEIDLRVIHVVRDGRGVAWSLAKAYQREVKSGLQREIKPKSVSRTALRWTMVNLETEYLFRKLGPEKVMRLRYEDFVSNPADVMQNRHRLQSSTSVRPAKSSNVENLFARATRSQETDCA